MYGAEEEQEAGEEAMIDTGRRVEWCTVRRVKQILEGKGVFSFEHDGLHVFV